MAMLEKGTFISRMKPEQVREKKVLLISPNTKESIFDSRWVTAHLGVHRVASYIRAHGHYCEVWDCNIPIDQEHYETTGGRVGGGVEKEVTFEEICKKRDWDIIGFSILDATIEYDLSKIHQAKRFAPQAWLVAGGSQATLNYQTIFDKSPLNVVFLIEAEFSFLDFCNDRPWHEIPGVVFRNYQTPFTERTYWEINRTLDVSRMHQHLYWKKTASLHDKPNFYDINTFRLFMTNYCPVNCSFCTLTQQHSHATGEKAVAVAGQDASQIVWQCENVCKGEPDTKQIFFVDDDFFLIPKRTVDILTAMIQAKTDEGLPVLKSHVGEADLRSTEVRALHLPKDLRFICLSNINRLDETSVPLAAKAGFSVISCGVESTSLHVLQSINKPQTPEKIEHVTRLLLKYGVRPYYTLLLFTPFCEIPDLLIDLRGFRRLASMGVGLSIEPYLFPLHGTVFYDLDVPQRLKVIQIEGTDQTIKKGTAWLPVDPDTKQVFRTWEWVYPRFKSYDEQQAVVKHREKNYQAHTILDCLEMVLSFYHGYYVENPRLTQEKMEEMHAIFLGMGTLDTDSVGQVIKVDSDKMKMKSTRKWAMDIYKQRAFSEGSGRDVVPAVWSGGALRVVELPPIPEDKDINLGDINILAAKERVIDPSEAVAAGIH